MIASILALLFASLVAALGCSTRLNAQVQQSGPSRIVVETGERAKVRGSVSPQASQAFDLGRASGNGLLRGITLLLRSTQAQETALTQLLVDQQTPGNSRYHIWFSPQEYAAHFGLNNAGVAAIEAWLSSEGLSNFMVNPSHTTLSFDGNVARIEQVFSTEIHEYSFDGQLLRANASGLELPEAIAEVVDGAVNLNQFRPTPQVQVAGYDHATPTLTSSYNKHFLAPADVATMYDVNTLYREGYTGNNQQIAIVGQSSVDLGDIARFRSAAGLTARPPTLLLVPNTGTPVKRPGDELESDIDLEYSGAIAPDAEAILVYTGSDAAHNAFDALAYAVDQNLAPVISVSYGVCETALSDNEITRIERVLRQANAQGQTVLAASGDLGATGCDSVASQEATYASQGLAVQYPASSEYVTSVGGTMLDDHNLLSFWGSTNAPDGESAKSYIPEQAWNESLSVGRQALVGSGGGASVLFHKPFWQVSPGVPLDGARDVPDLALDAGANVNGYVYCSSDPVSGVQGSCAHGFLDASSSSLTVAGGTSFGSPILAGMVILTAQALGGGRLGNVNPSIYTIASSNPGAFNDILSGDNRQPCLRETRDCQSDGREGYSAGPGYDQVTGVGTPELAHLVDALTALPVIPWTSKLMLRQADLIVYRNRAFQVIATVKTSPASANGTIQFFLDDVASGIAVQVVNGGAQGTLTSATVGTHKVSAQFASTSGYTITSEILVDVKAVLQIELPAFTLHAVAAPLTRDHEVDAEILVTPSGGYSGVVTFEVSTTDTYLIENGCFILDGITVEKGKVALTTLHTGLSKDSCKELITSKDPRVRKFNPDRAIRAALRRTDPTSSLPAGAGLSLGIVQSAGILLLNGVRRRIRRSAAAFVFIAAVVTFCTGCGVTSKLGHVGNGAHVILITAYDLKSTVPPAMVSLDLQGF